MSNIETVFGANGSMKNKAIHVGTVRAYNRLFVEDEAYFSSNVAVDGTIEAKGGVKIGNTVLTEDLLNKSTSGVEGVVDTFKEPSSKKLKMDSDGVTLKHEYKSIGKFLKANAVASQNQIVTPTGFLAEDNTTKQSFMLPGIVGTDDLHVTNLHAKGYDKTATGSTTVKNEINIPTAKLNVTEIGGGTGGSTTISSSSLVIEGDIKGDAQNGLKLGDTTVSGNLTITGKTDLQGNVVFATDVTIPTLTVTKKLITQGTVTGGTSTSFDKISVNQIEANTKGVVEFLNPVQNVEMVVDSEKVMWDTSVGKFYKTLEQDVKNDFEKYFGSLNEKLKQTAVKNIFGVDTTEWEQASDPDKKTAAIKRCIEQVNIKLAYLKLTHFMYAQPKSFTKGDPFATPDPIPDKYEYEPIFSYFSPLAEYIFIKYTNADMLECGKNLYLDYRKGSTIGDYFAAKCSASEDYFFKFAEFCDYIITFGYGIHGVKSVKANLSTKSVVIELDNTITRTVIVNVMFTWSIGAINIKCTDSSGVDINLTKAAVPAGYNTEDAFFKNMLEYLVVNIFMMIKRNTDKQDITNPKLISKKFGMIPPYIDTTHIYTYDNFERMPEYINSWKNETFFTDYVKKIDGVISEHLAGNKAFDYIGAQEVVMAEIKWFVPTWYAWTTGTTDKEMDLIYKRSPSSFIMEVPDMKVKYTCPYDIIQRMYVSNISGDTTIGGTLYVDNIATNASNVIQMGNTNFTSVSINGIDLIPTANNTACNMGFTTESCVIYAGKSTSGPVAETDTYRLTDELGNPSEFKAAQVYVDYNNVGQMYFVTIRPFTIERKPLMDKYISSTSGVGTIYLPIGEFNPYSFKTRDDKKKERCVVYDFDTKLKYKDGKDANGKDIYKTIDPKNYTCKTTPSNDNPYILGTSKWQWIKCEVRVDSTDEQQIKTHGYKVIQEGEVDFEVFEKSTKYVRLNWKQDLITDPGNSPDFVNYRDYVYIDGISFVALAMNKGENYGFYKGINS